MEDDENPSILGHVSIGTRSLERKEAVWDDSLGDHR